MTMKTHGDEMVAEINTTPLIDVMLVLLTLLIITLPLQTNAVKLDMPHGPVPQTQKPAVIDVVIDFDNTVLWNGQVVDREQFDRRLIAAAKQVPQPELHIQPDRLAKYDIVAKVMSDAQAFGIKKIGFTDTQQFKQ